MNTKLTSGSLMLCPSCKDGYICEPTPKPLILSYRGFSRHVATLVYLACSNCLYEATEPLESTVDVDAEMITFKRDINRRFSTGEEL